MSNNQTPTEYRRVLNHSTPVTVGLVLVIVGGVVANLGYMRALEEKMDTRYVTRELFEARMDNLTVQIANLKEEVRRQGAK